MSEEHAEKVSLGYVLGRIQQSLESRGEATRARLESWKEVLQGLLEGSLLIGSRTPLAGVPAWATPEVLPGGFASGELLAEGPERGHERRWRQSLPLVSGLTRRGALNLYFLSGEGSRNLDEWIENGEYRVSVPEEGALLVIRMLQLLDQEEAALAVLEEILPFSGRLRFYPEPHRARPPGEECLSLRTVGQLRRELAGLGANPRIETQREALRVWRPLCDRGVDLLLETVEGEWPYQEAGKLLGGWPCQTYPAGWADRVRDYLAEVRRARADHRLSGKSQRPEETLSFCADILERAVVDPEQLGGRELGRLRLRLAGYLARHGEPGSPERREARTREAQIAQEPSRHAFAPILLERLRELPGGEGVEHPQSFLEPLDPEEARRLGIPEGSAIPSSLGRRVERVRSGSLEELAAAGLLSSAEMLGRLLPPVTARARFASAGDPRLGNLLTHLYESFRRRRSLLLLDLQSQVRFEELPWVEPLLGLLPGGLQAAGAPREVLERVVPLVLECFPWTQLPNALVRELRVLAREARLDLPLVEELAADIFMGEFTGKHLRAAREAGKLLTGTLYQRYYGLPFEELAEIREESHRGSGKTVVPGFAALCRRLAQGAGCQGGWSPAANGMVLEQAQILTTHNLASLVWGLGMGREVRARGGERARTICCWVLRRLGLTIPGWVSQLRNLKNAAYAWRQMLFHLSLAPVEEQQAFPFWARTRLGACPPALQRRFEPALRGIELALSGGTPDVAGSHPSGARRFLGWTQERHWLMPEPS